MFTNPFENNLEKPFQLCNCHNSHCIFLYCTHLILIMSKVYDLWNMNFPSLLVHTWGAVWKLVIVYLRGFFFFFQVYGSCVGVFCFSTSMYIADLLLDLFYFHQGYIRGGDDLRAFIIRYNLSNCGDYMSVFPRVFCCAMWGQSPQADKQKEKNKRMLKSCENKLTHSSSCWL